MHKRFAKRALSAACELAALESRRLLSVGVDGRLWYIDGDVSRNNPTDVIVVEVDPNRAGRLRASINGTVVGKVDAKAIDTIYVDAGLGDDRVLVKLGARHDNIRVRLDGGVGNDSLLGGAGRDELHGGRGDDLLDGGAGADLMLGEKGNDELAGGDDADILRGDGGADTLSGGWGRDEMAGGDGNDQIRGGADGDMLYGNAGADTLRGSDGRDKLTGGPDKDRILVESTKDQAVGGNSEIRYDPGDDSGAILRMHDRDAWADHIIAAGIAHYRDQLGQALDRDGGIRPFWLTTTRGNVFRAVRNFAVNDNVATLNLETSAAFTTNVQVNGIDEADIVETDGRFIYTISNDKLVITNVQNPDSLAVSSTTTLGTYDTQGMYLNGNTLTVVSTVYDNTDYRPPQQVGNGIWLSFADRMYSGKPRVQVKSFDISNRSAPTEIATTHLDGWYQSSRMIDGRLYVAVTNGLQIAPTTVQDGENWRWETQDEFSQRVRNELDEFSPKYTVSADGNEVDRELVDSANVYLPSDANADLSQTTTLSMIDTANPATGPVASASYAGTGGITYVANDALYLVNNSWRGGEDRPSQVIKFGLSGTNLTVAATGSFDGQIINQYSLDQHDGFLRVASTERNGGPATNSVTVLDQVGDELVQVGKLENVAPGEQIFASRFIADEVFFTTATEIIDPLWTVDLSDPTSPRVLGELVVPGVSTYLHQLDDNHLIGFGRNGTMQGFGDGLQLSLFDITDRGSPQLKATYEFGTADDQEWSPASSDAHAFSFDPSTGLLMLPIHTNSGSRLEMVHVDADAGFTKVGEIGGDDSFVRGVWVGDTVFAIGTNKIRSADMDSGDLKDEISFD